MVHIFKKKEQRKVWQRTGSAEDGGGGRGGADRRRKRGRERDITRNRGEVLCWGSPGEQSDSEQVVQKRRRERT
jgi:hypothetical protein